MAESMTGYGRADCMYDSRRFLIEIKSINNRFCDVQVRMPRALLSLEPQIRDRITSSLTRGKIDVFVTIEDQGTGNTHVAANLPLARSYSEALTEIAAATGRMDTAGSDFIARLPDVMITQSTEWTPDTVSEPLFQVLDLAVEDISNMRKIEGAKLLADILAKVDGLEAMREILIQRAPLVPAEYRVRLKNRMDELLGDASGLVFDEGRKEAEVAIFADKCAIDEELVRLESHLQQLRTTLAAQGSIGKKLDFILQEVNREINTIGSKANDITTTNLVLDMKTDLEKVREQIQNLA
jgi:uncharacterized protein (TIGR00255 family)